MPIARHTIGFASGFYGSGKRRRYRPMRGPVRNPFAPGAGQRPPELAGRDREVDAFEIVLERVARGRPERSLVLTGLRGVGKTVLLGELRSMAVRAGWGAGQDRGSARRGPAPPARRPPCTAPSATSPSGTADPDRVDEVLGVLKAFVLRSAPDGAKLRDRWQPGIDVAVRSGRADSGDIEIDLVELFTEVAALAADVETGVALLIDEMQDLRPDDVSALCAACHELSQSRAPLVVVGAGLPHLPAVLSASKSYSERLFRYVRIGQLDRADADFALLAPAEREDATFDADALDALFAASSGYPYFVQAYGKAAWDAAPRSPIGARDVTMAAPEAEAELAVGLLRLPVRARDTRRAGVPAGDGRARHRPRRAGRRRRASPTTSSAGRPHSRRPATA